jgi:hypothetical protein
MNMTGSNPREKFDNGHGYMTRVLKVVERVVSVERRNRSNIVMKLWS